MTDVARRDGFSETRSTGIGLRALALWAAELVATCTDGGYRVVIDFEPAGLADAVDRVEVSPPQECDPEGELGITETGSTVVIRRGEREGGLGYVAAGRVVLQGRGFDRDGCLVAVGCATVELEPRGSGDLRLTLEPSRGLVECSADGDGDADAETDAETDADRDAAPPGLTGPGPASFVVLEASLVTERLCDLDGDGALDNSIADLGASADLVIMAIMAAAPTERLTSPFLIHIPHLRDRDAPSDPDLVALSFRGVDLDDDPSDNLSGAEPSYAGEHYLDDCGEPRYALEESTVDDGVFVATGGDSFQIFGRSLPLRGARAEGTIEPGCTGAELWICGAALNHDLGDLDADFVDGGRSMLEVSLAGGSLFGLPTVPGLRPDLDGDGLERVLVDEDGYVQTCVDGDMTVIEGRDCWRDPPMADAFALTGRGTYTSASFAGREPGWERRAELDEPPFRPVARRIARTPSRATWVAVAVPSTGEKGRRRDEGRSRDSGGSGATMTECGSRGHRSRRFSSCWPCPARSRGRACARDRAEDRTPEARTPTRSSPMRTPTGPTGTCRATLTRSSRARPLTRTSSTASGSTTASSSRPGAPRPRG